MPFLYMRDRMDIIKEFRIAEAAAAGRVSGIRDHEWVDMKERKRIEN